MSSKVRQGSGPRRACCHGPSLTVEELREAYLEQTRASNEILRQTPTDLRTRRHTDGEFDRGRLQVPLTRGQWLEEMLAESGGPKAQAVCQVIEGCQRRMPRVSLQRWSYSSTTRIRRSTCSDILEAALGCTTPNFAVPATRKMREGCRCSRA